jgi:serine/threonine-protein kinase RsbW
MRVSLSLALPREALSIPITRRMLSTSMHIVGVEDDCVGDINLALSEACTNVLDHAEDGDNYEVVCYLNDQKCIIEVIDRGAGFESADLGIDHADPESEAGRGIQLMRRLVDRVRFENRPRGGTVVHLEKALYWREDAPLR